MRRRLEETTEQRAAIMRAVKSRDTAPELAVRTLHSLYGLDK